MPRSNKFPVVNQEDVARQQATLKNPVLWNARMIENHRLPLFVSTPYITDGEKLVGIDDSTSVQLHPPIPNRWLIDHNQDMLSTDVLTQDSDGDGFTTFDEFSGNTDPQDKNSHPPYYTKLVYTQFKPIPFRLRFDAKNGETVQINIIDIPDAPTWFGKVGGTITLTKPNYKVVKFESKSLKEGGITKDVSEVTVQNLESQETIVLPKAQEVNSPTTYAVMNYLWSGKPFAVKKNQEFTLKPEDNVKYKVLDLNDTEVRILKEDENKELHIKMAGK